MCKKLFLAAVAIFIGVVIVRSTQFGSLVQVWWNDAGSYFKKSITPEVKIKQLKIEMAKIDAEIKQNISRLAGQEREKEKLEKVVEDLRKMYTSLDQQMAAMEKTLEAKADRISFDGKQYSKRELAHRLARATTQFLETKNTLKFKEQQLDERLKGLEESDRRVSWMKQQNDRLQTEVAELERLLEKQKRQHIQGVAVDESQIDRCNALRDEIMDELRVKELETRKLREHGIAVRGQTDDDQKTVEEIRDAAAKARQESPDAVASDKK